MHIRPNDVGVGWLCRCPGIVWEPIRKRAYPNSSGNTRSQSSQVAEPLCTDPGLKSGISVRELISKLKKKLKKREKKSAGGEWIVEHSPKNPRTRWKSHYHHCFVPNCHRSHPSTVIEFLTTTTTPECPGHVKAGLLGLIRRNVLWEKVSLECASSNCIRDWRLPEQSSCSMLEGRVGRMLASGAERWTASAKVIELSLIHIWRCRRTYCVDLGGRHHYQDRQACLKSHRKTYRRGDSGTGLWKTTTR